MYVPLDYSVGKVGLVSGSHDLVSEVLKNRGSANSRLRRLRLEVAGVAGVVTSRIFWAFTCQNGGVLVCFGLCRGDFGRGS